MRTGLAAAGAALLLLGAGTMIAVSVESTTHVDTRSMLTVSETVAPHQAGATPEFWGTNQSAPTFEIRWSASTLLDLQLLATCTSPGSCPRSSCPTVPCSGWTPVYSWFHVRSGTWHSNGSVSFPYMATYSNPGNSTAGLLVVGTSGGTATGATSVWAEAIPFAAGGVLAGIGAVALFLGLFLRPGVFTGRRARPPGFAP